MKKLFCIFVICCIPFFSASYYVKVSAETNYMRVITEDTPLYSDSQKTDLLFYLPYTYYVKVIRYEGELAYVECYGKTSIKLDGYVPADLLYYDGLSVTDPYADVKISTIKPSVMYTDKALSTPLQYVFSSRQLDYYGKLLTDYGIIYYVGYNGQLGYVKESDVTPFELENHPNELTFIKTQTPQEEQPDEQETPTEQKDDDFSTLKITIVICLAVAGIIGFFIATKKRTVTINETANTYYDENDYE